ncbi:MAG: hypothetical protein JO069_20580 [Verrucomicrobia bacterium]|nr:hypothetical protein [Verrucomicrobiota bacterium]
MVTDRQQGLASAPKLRYLETKFAAPVAYGRTVKLLEEVLPIDQALSPGTPAVAGKDPGARRGAGEHGVTLLGNSNPLEWSRDQDGVKVKLPATKPGDYGYAFRIDGLKLEDGP